MEPFIVVDGGACIPSLWIPVDEVESAIEYYLAKGLEGIECDGALIERVTSLRPRFLHVRGL
jgi:hypothetical protein